MKFTIGILWSLVLSSAAAFGPKPLILPTTSAAAAKDGSSPLWRPPMNMAAGGAERAYQDEYYEGTYGLPYCLQPKSRRVFVRHTHIAHSRLALTNLPMMVFGIALQCHNLTTTQVYELDPLRICLPCCCITVLFTLVCLWSLPSPSW